MTANASATAIPEQRDYSHAERLRVVTGVITCILLVALDQSVVLPAIPQIAANLHGDAHLSWVVSAYLLTTTATTPIYGKLSDHIGRYKVLAPALLVFLAACVVCAVADSVPMLALGRALQGLGGGALAAVGQAAVADVVPPRERGRYQGWFASMWALSSLAGPVVGGFITQHLSWRWIFWGNLPLAVIALVMSTRALRSLPVAGTKGRIDYAGAALLMFSVAATVLALSEGGTDFPWLSWQEAAIWAAALLGFALLAAQQRIAPAPLLPAALLSRVGGVALLGGLTSAALFTAIFLLPLLLQWIYGETASTAGLHLVPMLFASTIGAFAAGQTTRRTGQVKPVLTAALLIGTIGYGLLCFSLHAASPLWPVGFAALGGIGLGGLMPTTLVAVQSLAHRGEMGAATGILLVVRAMGGTFGATLAGVAITLAGHASLSGFRLGFLAAAIFLVLGVALVVRLPRIDLHASVTTGKPA
ncbi:MDR family MFS transporter [Acidocella aromatica]|uniref:EmrB/QacA subfamily drug resistance transporter n=1 Tax=Acidocella aromatica TaxID=1303579 RepID=A0A840VBI2_9PROT|nr:MDR family MFS transporter [Acidocella aromatica]MBB5372974.1 EmrB/QacA subfamily drug resistance transporter [Acidocella aromatica]